MAVQSWPSQLMKGRWEWDFSTLSGKAMKVEKKFLMSGEAASGEILFLPQLLSHE